MIRAADSLAEGRRIGPLAGSAESPWTGPRATPDPRRGERRLGRLRRGRPARERRCVRPRPPPPNRDPASSTCRHALRRQAGRSAQHRHRARRPADRRPRRHPVLDEPRHPAHGGPSCVHGRHRRWGDRGRAGPGVRAVRDRVTVVEVAPRVLALEEPQASRIVADRAGRRRHPGARRREDRVGGARRRPVHGRRDRRRRHRPRPGRRPPPRRRRAPPEPRGHRPRHRRSRPVGTLRGDRRADAGRRRLWAVGDITGKGAFTHMSMYQSASRCATSSARRARAAYHAVPRVTFTDPEVGSVGLTEQRARNAGLACPSGSRRSRRPRAAGSTGRRRGPHQSRRGRHRGAPGGRHGGRAEGRRGPLDARHRGPRGVPTATLRSMPFAYPTFHRAVETALADLEG